VLTWQKITKRDVEYVAALAQLSPDEETKDRLVREMGDILAYMDKLNELDTSGIEPTMHAVPITNVFRDDVAVPGLERDDAPRQRAEIRRRILSGPTNPGRRLSHGKAIIRTDRTRNSGRQSDLARRPP